MGEFDPVSRWTGAERDILLEHRSDKQIRRCSELSGLEIQVRDSPIMCNDPQSVKWRCGCITSSHFVVDLVGERMSGDVLRRVFRDDIESATIPGNHTPFRRD